METNPEILDEDACWALLADAEVGRVAFADGDDVEIFPVNFAVGGRSILFRSAPGSKLALVLSHPRVAFQADGRDDVVAWSVVVHGEAERLAFDDEIEHSGVLSLVSWSPSEKFNYVRITPDRVSGRRITRGTDDTGG
ncbi:pyridoxamine 5'-phosphate oxidase family protein [Protaetiibacter larvae]|uniref:Pyridoxamine 5'-phosphate oxidase family protein n=1 Tax=Protaetiibacter larvae TaxID=2592654 RepID=A0A5C1Y6C1_9MICO|nr:pyridoxamine 5'-phosphate oxidase family protein [Protaetiibacter larvae]QEO09444.1 pyridoxamine 5'-phosphate oxidase family protein [Protaetiibacter larvae]